MGQGFSVPGILVNNEPIAIVPNSFKFKLGRGETVVRSASTGGGGTQTIHTQNAEDRVGMFTFEMYVTPDTIESVNTWKSRTAANVVQAVQASQTPLTLTEASMTNDPDFEATSEGKVEIIFSGDAI
jgi:hypothetical protein